MMHRFRHLLLMLAVFLPLSHPDLPPLSGVASAQSVDVTALVRQFSDAVNRRDAAAAAALFSDDANYTAWAACQGGCKDRAEIVNAISSQKLPSLPETYSVEQTCGDTAAVLVQNTIIRGDRYVLETFHATGGRITAHIRDPRYSLSLTDARSAAADVCGGVKPLNVPAGANSAQDPDNAFVLARFFDRVNHGDSRGAAALFSDSGIYKHPGACSNICTDRAEIAAALATNWRARAPYSVTIEQVCGDSMVALTLPADRAASVLEEHEWNVAIFRLGAGQILSGESAQANLGLKLQEAHTAAAAACGVQVPDAPGPVNKGGLLPLETRLTLIMSALMLATVAAVLIALLLRIGRRLKTRA